jgi:hypothetical protein
MQYGECREKPILCVGLNKMYLEFCGSHHLHKNNHVNTCKLYFGVTMHSEISKKKIFLDFLDMIYAKQKHSHHTPVYKEL